MRKQTAMLLSFVVMAACEGHVRVESEPTAGPTPTSAKAVPALPAAQVPAQPPCDRDAAFNAALYALPDDLVDAESFAEVKERRIRLQELREWASAQAPCPRNAYEQWLDYYDGKLNARQRQLLRHEPEKDYMADVRERQARTRDYIRETHFPKPPKAKELQ